MTMTIKAIKEEMLLFNDFYGGDIPDTDSIRNAKTKNELAEVLSKHKRSMEDMLCDAISHLDKFKKELGL